MRIGGEERWIASEDAGLYRDALGAVPPGGLPEVFLEEVEEPLARLVRRYARTHGPFTTRELARPLRARLRPGAARAGARRRPRARRAAPRRQRARVVRHRTCCGACAARRSRRCARRSSRPSSARSRASCRRGRAWTARRRAAPASTGCARCSCRSRASPSRPRSGSATCCRGAWARYSPAWMDQLCAGGELVWVGAGALGTQLRAGRALLPRGRALARPAAVQGRAARRARSTRRCASGSGAARRSGPTCWRDISDASSPRSSRRRSGTSSGPAR